jgi:type VI secretion system secreted protein VgrG
MPVNASNITILGPKKDGSEGSEPRPDLMLETFRGHEALGTPYRYELTILTKDDNIPVDHLLGKPFTVQIDRGPDVDPELQYRYFNGIVTYFSKVGPTVSHTRYALVLQPALARLAYASNCRIFNDASNAALDAETQASTQDTLTIVKQVLQECLVTSVEGVPDKDLQVNCDRRYCVQYRETNLNFVQRLLEEEGIYYFFKHTAEQNTLVFANSMASHDVVDGYDPVLFMPGRGNISAKQEHFWSLRVAGSLYPQKYSVMPGYDYLDNRVKGPKEGQVASEVSGKKLPGEKFEVYDYPGALIKVKEINPAVPDAKVRMEIETAANTVVEVEGNTVGLGVGDMVSIDTVPDQETGESYNPFWATLDLKKKHLITEATYSMSINEHESGDAAEGEPFTVTYTLLDGDLRFRPPRTAVKPRIEGPQTAVIVSGADDPDEAEGGSGGSQGNAGGDKKDTEEIYTDKLGRVKVKFDWDRSNRNHQKASCWVRVAQIWAGQNWGAIHIPRVGQEVIVEFLDGDPDRPLITGRLYNTDNPPPYTLPDDRSKSGIKSRSTNEGTPKNYNEIMFEDRKGEELLNIQAEKTMSTLVKASQSLSVGGDRSVTITGNESITIKGKGKDPVHSLVDVTGKHKLSASDTIEIIAPTSITLTCKGSTITMTPDAITMVSGGKAKVELTADVKAKANGGATMTLDATANLKSNAGSIVVLDGDATMTSKGESQVKLTGDAVMVGKAKATVQGKSEATLVAGGSVKTSPAGVEATGTMVKLNS